MTEFCLNWQKTSVLAFILIIINEEPTFGPRSAFVLGYQQFFRVRPSDKEVIEDQEVLLQCQVANQVGLVQWSKDGFLLGFDPDVPGWPRYSMSVDRQRGVYNLKIRNAQLIDEGEIECQVGPAKENKPIRAKARITVLDSYSVVLKQGLGPSGKLSSTSSTLYIYTRMDDNGVQYTCEGQHPALPKPIKSTITLSVLYPPGQPSIEGASDGDVISASDTLTLACISRGGNPLAKLIWYKDSREVDNTYSSSGGRESTNIYSFTVTPSDNNAHYKCEATNDVTTQPLIAFIRLNVLFPAVKVEVLGPKQGRIGDLITLTCVAGPANPAAEVSWMIDSRAVLPLSTWTVDMKEGWITTTNITFTLTSQDPDTKTVSCYAFSVTLGETIVQTVNIDILYPPGLPTIIGYNQGTNLGAGELYRFQCDSMGGNPLPTLRWQVLNARQGSAGHEREISALTSISGSGVSSELVIRAEAADNGATYRCEASNPATTKPLSASITLSVFYISETVTIKLKPKYPKNGDLMSLHCDSGPCNPICEVFWYKNNIQISGQHDGVIDTNTPFGGKSTRSKLRLNVTSKDDESEIVCEAVNQVLSKTTRANITLRVLFKPEFAVPPLQKFDVIESADVSVNLSAKGNPSLISYSWWKDSLPLLDETDITTTITSNAILPHRQHRRQHQLLSRGPILKIKNVFREDAGEYDCEATNSEGSSKTTILINVLFAPIIVDISKLVLVNSGESASLYCLAVGNPMTDDLIQWRKEGNTNFIKDTRIKAQIEKGRSTLWITDVSADKDSGEYECRANNGVGEEVIETVKLLIKMKPKIILNMTTTNIASDETENVKMVCTATGVPKVLFKWIGPENEFISRESELLANNNVKYFRYSVDPKQIDDTHFQSILTIKRVTHSDLNKPFKCVAHNEKGETEALIKLRKRGKPDSPKLLKIINITHNSVFLTWTPSFDGGLRQSFKVKYHKIESNSFDDQITDENWISIKGLESAADYTFTVLAFNGFGESDWDESNISVRASTYATEFDSSEALIDSLNRKSNPAKKSVSKIIMIIVFVLGLFLIILNACLVLCYLKWKRKIDNGNKHKTKKVKAYTDAINGEAILMKALSEEDVALTTALMPMPDQTAHSPNTKHCEVLMMSDLNSSSTSSSAAQQPLTHVLLRKCENKEFKYKRKSLSLEAENCPDIIKDYEIESTNCGNHPFNNYCISINGANNATSTLMYNPCNSIQMHNNDKLQLRSILKNGSLKSKQKQEISML